MNPVNFPVFEREIGNMEDTEKVKQCLLCSIEFKGEIVKLGLARSRVSVHNNLISIENIIQCVVLILLT